MSFLFPFVLWGLGLLAIPIIIHLFQFRRFKTIWFSDIRFLEAIQQQTKNKQKLLHYLVLALRLLAFSALIFAFAQPFIPSQRTHVPEGSPIYIYLDNSPSMDATIEQGSFLNLAKEKVSALIQQYGTDHPYKFITNTKVAPSRNWMDGQMLRQELADLQADGPPVMLATILESIKRDADNFNGYKRVFIFSDFQEKTFQTPLPKNDSTLLITVTAMSPVSIIPNISIDSIWFETPIFRPGFEQIVHIRLTNHGDEDVSDIPLRLYLNDISRGVLRTDLEAQSFADVQMPFTPTETGFVSGRIEIEDAFVPFDDRYLFSIQVTDQKKAVHLFDIKPNPLVQRILDDELVDYQSFNFKNLNPERLSIADFIVLDELQEIPSGLTATLNNLLNQGKNILLIPAPSANLDSYNAFLSMMGVGTFGASVKDSLKVAQFRETDVYFSGVFQKSGERLLLPSVTNYYPISAGSRQTGRSLMAFANNIPFVIRYSMPGQLIVFAVPLAESWSNLATHPLLLPLIYQGVVYANTQIPPALELGAPTPYPISIDSYDGQHPIYLISEKSGKQFIPPIQRYGKTMTIFSDEVIQQQGFYQIKYRDEQVGQLAFNIAASESQTRYATESSISAFFIENGWTDILTLQGSEKEWVSSLIDKDRGTILWPYFIIFAIVCLLSEAALLRWIGN
jgi:hypothetical protein